MLSLALLLLLLSSCKVEHGGGDISSDTSDIDPMPTQSEPGSESSTPTQSETEPESTPTESLPDISLKDDQIVVLQYNTVYPEFGVDEDYGEFQPVSDEIYKRHAYVSEVLNADIVYKTPSYTADEFWYYIETVKKDATLSADIVAMAKHLMITCLITRGHVENFAEYEEIDLEKPWWPKKLIEDTSIKDGIYFVVGDISSGFMLSTEAIFYNRDMLSELKLSDPALAVEKGEWTYDKLVEMTAGVYKDTDRVNGVSDDDRFGIGFDGYSVDTFFISNGLSVIKRSYDIIEQSDEISNGKIADFVNKMSDWVNGGDVLTEVYNVGAVNASFSNGHTLFAASAVELGVKMKDGDINYGILPIPIYNPSAQSEYMTKARNNYILYSLIENSDIKELSVKAIELMGEYSHQNIKPIIKELAFKTKSDGDMFELIYEGVRFDLADMFDSSLFSYIDKPVCNGVKWETYFVGMTDKNFRVSVERLNKTLKDVARLCGNE